MVAIIEVERAVGAIAAELNIAPGRLELHVGAIFGGHVETQPVVPLIAVPPPMMVASLISFCSMRQLAGQTAPEATFVCVKSNELKLRADADVARADTSPRYRPAPERIAAVAWPGGSQRRMSPC
jgi:hypothetical protein